MKEVREITVLTPDEVEKYVCSCGNTATASGFYPCDIYGVKCEPDKWWDGFYVCEQCGNVTYIASDKDIERQKIQMKSLAGQLLGVRQGDSTFYFEVIEIGRSAWKLQNGNLEELLIQHIIKRAENNTEVNCKDLCSSVLQVESGADYEYSVGFVCDGNFYKVFLECRF